MNYTLKGLLRTTGDMRASDLYCAVESTPVVSKDGELQSVGEAILGPADTEAMAHDGMNEAQFAEFQKKLEYNVSYRLDSYRFRINFYYQRGTISFVARVIRHEILSFTDLGLPEILGRLVMAERGIILVTGATGSGKSTTLATMVDYRNVHSSGHIITIEDPIEFVHEHKKCIISQREVGIDTHSFSEALKSALRQAPKVILIGEIRDLETARFAILASDTGHLVLSTLHTNNANQTLERIINLFPAEQEASMLLQLSLNLRAVVSQRLLPKLGGGRIVAIELLLNTPRVQELIQNKNIAELKTAMAKGGNDGMETFDIALCKLVRAGAIDEPTALKFADSANDLKLRLRGIGGSGMG